jgi:small conductance mechanosensitive channel
MSIAYDADFEKAKQLILDVCNLNDLIDKTPEPFVAVGAYAASSVDLNIRVWTNNANYWTVHRYLMHEVKKSFDANGIEIPFNQLDVTIKQ